MEKGLFEDLADAGTPERLSRETTCRPFPGSEAQPLRNRARHRIGGISDTDAADRLTNRPYNRNAPKHVSIIK